MTHKLFNKQAASLALGSITPAANSLCHRLRPLQADDLQNELQFNRGKIGRNGPFAGASCGDGTGDAAAVLGLGGVCRPRPSPADPRGFSCLLPRRACWRAPRAEGKADYAVRGCAWSRRGGHASVRPAQPRERGRGGLGCRAQAGWLFVSQHPTPPPPPYFSSDLLNY